MRSKNYTKQRYGIIQGLRSFKNTLPLKIKKVINKKGHIFSETLENWKYIVGDELFKICFPRSFKNANRVGKSYLSIMVKRGNEVDVEYSKKIIINKMNTFFGYNVIDDIKLITFEDEDILFKKKQKIIFTNNEFSKKISKIKNEKVKDSLLELSKFFKKK